MCHDVMGCRDRRDRPVVRDRRDLQQASAMGRDYLVEGQSARCAQSRRADANELDELGSSLVTAWPSSVGTVVIVFFFLRRCMP